MVVQTHRLIIRPFTPQDWPDIHSLAIDWSKAPGPAFDKWPTAEEETKGLLDLFMKRSSQFHAVYLRGEKRVIGLVSLQVHDDRQGDIGHVILSAYQNNDIDREALGAVVDYTFTNTDAESIVTHNAPEHEEQIAPLKALGFRNINADVKGEYVLLRAEWEARRP